MEVGGEPKRMPSRSRRPRPWLALALLLVVFAAIGWGLWGRMPSAEPAGSALAVQSSGGKAGTGVLSSRALPPCGDPSARFTANWVPKRKATAATGSGFVKRTTGYTGRKRQEAALKELRQGNVPDFNNSHKPVRLHTVQQNGEPVDAIVGVTPDYLSIGTDADFVRIPHSLPVTVTIASELGFIMPTCTIVDSVYAQSDFRVAPVPLPPGKMMRSSRYYQQHNERIEAQRQGRPLGELISGNKKDIVLTNRLFGTERIAIYGWHKPDGEPIQPLSLVHGARYADYSHGVRLVYSIACIDGEPTPILEVLQNPELCTVLSNEGQMRKAQDFMNRRKWK
jgi:hypothetical protein